MKTSEQINELAAAMAKAQGQMKGAVKDSANPFFSSKYADLESVWDACREPLSGNGLCVIQTPRVKFVGSPEPYEWTSKGGEKRYGVRVVTQVSVVTRLIHTSGQWLQDVTSTILPTGDAQAVGSAITYLRRYALQSVAGIAPEDDDGNKATGKQDHAEAPDPTTLPFYDLRLAIQEAAQELEQRGGGLWPEHVRKASAFVDKQNKAVPGFPDPFNPKVRSEAWLKSTHGKLIAALESSEPGAAEAADLFT